MNKPPTYTRLDQVLQRLGFVKTTLPSSQFVYQHEPSNTVLYFRSYRPDDIVSPTDLAVTRKFLTERGLIDEKAFEGLFQQPAA